MPLARGEQWKTSAPRSQPAAAAPTSDGTGTERQRPPSTKHPTSHGLCLFPVRQALRDNTASSSSTPQVMSERFKNIAKNGWRPEKSSSSSSSSSSGGGVRGRVNGLLSRPLGGSASSSSESRGAAMPIASLKDPNSFGPPPKHVAAGGQVVPTSTASAYQSRQPPALPAPSSSSVAGDVSGGRANYSPSPVQEEEQPRPPPKPFKIDSSGLSTSHLPPPPARRDGADGRAPGTGPLGPGHTSRTPTSPVSPARTSTQSPAGAAPANRLGAAGISVPGFGIGGGGSRTTANTTAAADTPPPPASAGGGTTWAQKQAALRTVSQFNKDPSSVSLADAKAAAGTANNFRERHGAQVASGLKTANSVSQRFGGGAGGGVAYNTGPTSMAGAAASFSGAALAAKKKAAPPPPKKKPGLSSTSAADGDSGGPPPPIPLATRPTF
ncbi:uncharacterized protein B0I36DRAFT_345754 [Microdochium trichocladiopsis]|uniref:Uncharacterized protein n=1 Tax=Microdochium trichocladiopsis TaxID=1682393 RepID=A0A9P9BU36_9PEZI|nr:uncharacterized protein B0I36DRAFT_345754 [Microdochium trichocladiopsis]KAH7037677.1 hypothetical protein B0I36DRAFT_345754 [Microdochium trichocladiopsis]